MGKSYSEKVKSRSTKNKAHKNQYGGSENNKRSEDKPPFPFAPVIVIGIILILIVVSVVMYSNNPDDDGDNTIIIANNGNKDPADDSSDVIPYGSILLSTTDGSQIFLDQYKGKVVILDMFATWCGPCKTQMIELEKLESRFTSSELVILSVDADTSETMEQVTNFKRDEGATWPFAMSNGNFNSAFPASSIPTMYVLDKDGSIGKTHVGVTSADILEDDVNLFL